MSPVRLGILGGTFDPIHNGHLHAARIAADELGLDEVLFMPAGNPHFKLDQPYTEAGMRAEMVRLAIDDEPRFSLDLREVEREGVTYTADTLEELACERPDAELFFIIGSDAAATLVHWRRAAALAELARFAVVSRPGTHLDEVKRIHSESPLCFDLVFLNSTQLDVSSRQIRELVAAGKTIDAFVAKAVAEYIAAHRLYVGQG